MNAHICEREYFAIDLEYGNINIVNKKSLPDFLREIGVSANLEKIRQVLSSTHLGKNFID